MAMDTPFKLDDDIIYVNHAAVAPWPQVSVQAVKDFADENGYVGSRHYMRWLKIEQELKQRLATLINAASVDEIALLKNTSEGLSVIAYGLDWQAGDNIIIAAEEFPSNRIVWESLVHKGVNVQLVDLNGAADPEQLLISHINEHTRLLSVSGVQYARGLRMDLFRLGKACRQNRILFRCHTTTGRHAAGCAGDICRFCGGRWPQMVAGTGRSGVILLSTRIITAIKAATIRLAYGGKFHRFRQHGSMATGSQCATI
jgi:kynureninase